jgi:endonuclease/exonuclease/phosphatase family metal-dependent hydrolase
VSKKKSKSLFDRFLYLVNSIVAIVLLLAYIVPYISSINAPVLGILSLLFPLIFIINIIFAVFWIARLKRYFLLSLIILVIGFGYSSSVFKFSKKDISTSDDISVMSYNVRMFNIYGWNKEDSIAEKTYSFINDERPDILASQEYYDDSQTHLKYPYQYIKTRSKTNKFGLAIHSAYPIVNSGSLNFESSANNIIFSDIVVNKDTVRVYNIHLESFKLNPDMENFGEEDSDKLLKRMKVAFKKQGIQTQKFLAHQESWKGKSIVCGDFNNTAFSWVYKQIADDRIDAFKEAGKGMGNTFDNSYPLRIDFILPDTNFEVTSFKTFDIDYSDHFPILAKIRIQ